MFNPQEIDDNYPFSVSAITKYDVKEHCVAPTDATPMRSNKPKLTNF